MREDGVPDAVLQALRSATVAAADGSRVKITEKRFGNSGEFEDAVDRAIRDGAGLTEFTSAEIGEFRKSCLKHSKEDSIFQFPIRLISMMGFIFLAPAMALGLISPVVAQMAIDASKTSGRAVGNVYAWGAVGSIFGTFLTGFILPQMLSIYSITAATALTLALLGVAVAAPRLVQSIWAILLFILVLPVFHQLRGANALDRDVDAVEKRNQGESVLQEFWHKRIKELGDTIRIRDGDLSDNTFESNYQFIKVSKRSHGDAGGSKDLLVLSLDHLIHGYVKLRMPRPDMPFNEETAEFDPTHLHYAYEEVYALSAVRGVESRFREDESGRMHPPKMKALFLGGGSYTFQRYLVDTYPGEEYVVQAGDTLRSIIERQYKTDGKMVESEIRDIEDRVARFNRDALVGRKPDQLDIGMRLLLPSLADTAELDPMVTQVNHTRLKLKSHEEEPRIKTWNYDARNFVESVANAGWTGRYDVIFQDAFNHYSVPYHLTTKEFNDKVSSLLAPDGVYVCNVIDKYETARFMSATVVTMRESFKHVYVLGDKRRSQRYGRETFVVVGSNKPLNLEHLGGYSERILRTIKEVRDVKDPNDPGVVKLREQMGATDPVGLEQILERLKSKTPDEVYNEMRRLKKIDFRVMWINEGDDPEDVRVRKSISFNAIETRDLIVEKGRPPSFGTSIRNMVMVRAFFGRTSAAFNLTADKAAQLRSEGVVPADVLAKLEPVLDKSFSTVEAFSDRLGELLTRADLKSYKSRIVVKARDWDRERAPPLVLSDSRAPVDDLLSPLFEED
jgi:hypothetical protein